MACGAWADPARAKHLQDAAPLPAEKHNLAAPSLGPKAPTAPSLGSARVPHPIHKHTTACPFPLPGSRIHPTDTKIFHVGAWSFENDPSPSSAAPHSPAALDEPPCLVLDTSACFYQLVQAVPPISGCARCWTATVPCPREDRQPGAIPGCRRLLLVAPSQELEMVLGKELISARVPPARACRVLRTCTNVRM